MFKNISRKTAFLLLSIKAISFQPNKPFKYTSGILSPIYIDNRILISYPQIRNKIIDAYIKVIKRKIGLPKIDLLSGTATAAIPYAAFIAQKLNLPMVYVRNAKKRHGRRNQIEGVVKKSQKVLVIEDHISTGESLINNAKAIRATGGKVKYALAITTYLMSQADKNFKKAKIKVFTLTDFNKIIEVAEEKKYIQKKDKNLILDWTKDPQNWGKKFGFEK